MAPLRIGGVAGAGTGNAGGGNAAGARASTLKVFFHDNCFDGTASAAIFSEFYRDHVGRDVRVYYQGVQHAEGDPFAGLPLDGDENACVDFRYCPDARMQWWFDHHVTAFQPPETRAHFEVDSSGKKFFDPTAPSCTGFLVRALERAYGYQVPARFGELVQWADIIDSAQFGDPRAAVDLDLPATKLMTWVRHNRDPALMSRYIEHLQRQSLAELAEEPWVAGPLGPLIEDHRRTIELIRTRAVFGDQVVYFDLTEDGVAAYNSFIAYYLFPEARYTVGVIRDQDQVKISVGYNPWSDLPREHDIAVICARHGGGGHPFVGGVSLPAGQLERGRRVASTIRAELASTP